MVHRDGYGFALDGVLRYQEEELLPPLTHQFLFFLSFFLLHFLFLVESLSPHTLSLSPSSFVVLISPFSLFSLVHLSHYCIISFRTGKRDGWMGPNSSAGEEGVCFLDVVLVLYWLF